MAEDATPLVGALPPDGIGKDVHARVIEATDNPRIIAALAAHGHPVAGEAEREVMKPPGLGVSSMALQSSGEGRA